MNVVSYSRSNRTIEGVTAAESLDDLISQSDIISLHVPNTKETKGMVNKEFLEKMKPNGVLINTSRGTAIIEEDLLAHLDENPNFWFGTDVLNGEPTEKE